MARRARPWFRLGRGWFVQVHGKQHNLNVSDPADEAAALAAFRELLRTLKSQGGPPPDPAAETVAGAVERFFEERTDLAPRTVQSYRWYLGQLAARFGTLKVRDLTARQVEADARGRAWSDDSRRNYLVAAEAVTKHAGCPLRLEKPPRGSAGAAAVVPEHVYHMAVGSASGDLRALLVVLWNTGARPVELRLLTAEQVDWDGGTATLTRHKTRRKGKASRLLVFPPPAMDALRGQREKYKAGLLFRTRLGTAYTCPGLAQAVWRVGKRIGHPLTAYGCRHTFATDGLLKGLPDTHVAALLGHGSTRMIHSHYSHINENARVLKDAAARIRGAG